MYAFSIVVHFNVLKNGYFCLISTGEDHVSTTLFLQCCPKTLHHGIIVAIPCTAHTRLDMLLLQQQLIARARIFTAAIGMVDQTSCWSSAQQCHLQCRFYQFCIMMLVHCPS